MLPIGSELNSLSLSVNVIGTFSIGVLSLSTTLAEIVSTSATLTLYSRFNDWTNQTSRSATLLILFRDWGISIAVSCLDNVKSISLDPSNRPSAGSSLSIWIETGLPVSSYTSALICKAIEDRFPILSVSISTSVVVACPSWFVKTWEDVNIPYPELSLIKFTGTFYHL